MPRLSAASVSDKVTRKCKRKAGPTELQDQASRDEDGNEIALDPALTKLDKRSKALAKKPSLRRSSSTASTTSSGSAVVHCDVEWPEHFCRLQNLFRVLNTVYVFCSTRKYVATTFHTLKTAVESQIRRPLLIDDVAQINCLVPSSINFAYVSEKALQIHVYEKGGGLKEEDVYEPTLHNEQGEESYVLYFEFIDGDLRRKLTRRANGNLRQMLNDDLKLPEYTPESMLRLISRRNDKFDNAVNKFLNDCNFMSVCPVERLLNEKEVFLPQKPLVTELVSSRQMPQVPAEIPKERESIEKVVKHLQLDEHYSNQVVPDGHKVFPAQGPKYGSVAKGHLSHRLSQSVVNALYNSKNITQFFSHQAEAINNLWDGNNVIVSTSTSSGKSLIYQVPVLHAIEQDPTTRAMYIFPTKALAQDQKRSLCDLLSYMDDLQDVVVDTFDGDTAMEDRARIRDEASIVFTNPDMLHITILPKEEQWRTFLKNLKYVVVDELHVYNGLFGSHVAFVMRRLRRICATLGNRRVQFISCSATVANPVQHMQALFGVDRVKLTDVDGSPTGRKEFLCWNCPFKDPEDPRSGRVDACTESARLIVNLILRGVRVIAFCKVRRMCEAVLQAVRRQLQYVKRPQVTDRVMSYRGGYTPQDRRRIEKEMFNGQLLGIVATNALELGIDIGSLDAVVVVGFPYSIANFQSGRAGRRNKDSLSILVGEAYPIDQHFMANPQELFTKPNCELQVDLANPLVVEGHLQCAAFEMPIRIENDSEYFGKDLDVLAHERLVGDVQNFFHCHPRFRPFPSAFVAIRDTEEEHFPIVDITHGRNVVLEELEASRAFFTIYDGAIFVHQGDTYLVREFIPDKKMAKVERTNVEWTTQQRDYTDVDPVETHAIRAIEGTNCRAYYGDIRITRVVFGFFKLDKKRRILDAVQVDNPPVITNSKGMWLDVPRVALEILQEKRINIAASIHAAEHAVISLMPNFVVSMPEDVRTECKAPQKEFAKKETTRKRPARLTFYDAKGGSSGSGISTKAFEFIDSLLRQAVQRVEGCSCSDGCPEWSAVISKAGASVILRTLLNWHINTDDLPEGPDEIAPATIETVIAVGAPVKPAGTVRMINVNMKAEEFDVRIKEENLH